MKKNIFGLSLCAVALSGLLAVSCSTEYTYVDVVADVPAITVSPVTLSADAGTYSFYYSVTNAASDATVSCTADVSWISNLDASVVGTVYFAVDENTADELRTGNVTLTYAYEDGAVTAKVGVIQYGQTTPSLEVDPNAVTAAYAGGTYSFGYSIYDGYDDGELSCSSDADWISDYDYSTYGTVSFTVAASEEETLRSATITVTYAYSGTSISKEVTVIQDHPGSGSGDEEDFIGTYTASGFANGQSLSYENTTWTLKVYAYSGTGGYDYYIDGLVPWSEGDVDYYGDYRTSAYASNNNGVLTIPSQGSNTTISTSSATYYLGYTPCTQYANNTFYYSSTYPNLTFTNLSGSFLSNYGILLCGCTSANDITSMQVYFQEVAPTITLTKTAGTTSLSYTGVTHSIMEGVHIDAIAVKAE